MIQFEKYLSHELNLINSTFFEFKLKMNSSIRYRFEEYKNDSFNMKNMFLINEAEKEILQNKKLLSTNLMINMLIKNNSSDIEILRLMKNAF